MTFFVNIVTLNCWAIAQPYPFGSKDRHYRLKKLIEALEASEYDIVTLQEIWSEKDFEKISTSLSLKFPYFHYFHSGFTGSGTCILSKYLIVSTLTHRYSLNGFAHHIHRGDWFGGKVVGVADLDIKGLRVSIYTTHLHAEYDRDNDLYLPHRISQAFELAQFLDHTSRGSDFVIVTGDFNIEPEDLGYHIITKIGNLEDAWLRRPTSNSVVESGMTCDRPDNCYTNMFQLKRWPEGKRIDYIMYQSVKKSIELTECRTCLGKIPNSKLNYSDHIGLNAKFLINTDTSIETVECAPHGILAKNLMLKSIEILEEGEVRALWDRRIFLAACFILLTLIIVTLCIESFFQYFKLLGAIMRFTFTLTIAFCFWHGFIGLTIEMKALKETKSTMRELLKKL